MPAPFARFLFVPMGELAPASAISCDGLVEGAALHLTHWRKNQTPAALRADTSTEIAFRFIDSPLAEAWKHSFVVNNHFDTDGVLAVFTMLCPDSARQHRALFVAAAEAGDFQEWPAMDDGLRLDAAITRLGELARDEGHAFATALPQVADLAANLSSREDLWGDAWQALRAGIDALHQSEVTIHRRGTLGIVRHSARYHLERQRELPGPLLHRAHPDASLRWMLFDSAAAPESAATFHARLEWPRHAWADTVVREPALPLDALHLAAALGPQWQVSPSTPGTTGIIETKEPISALPDLTPFL
jgi:hypothetical protein